MADKDLHTRIKESPALIITTITGNGTTNGTIIDMQGYDSIDFSFLSGASIGANLAVTMQDADDLAFTTAATVDSNFIIGTLPSYLIVDAEINTVKSVGYVGKRRFVRINVVATAFASNTVICAQAIRGDARLEATQ
jgi:hypothetical protein